MFTRSVIAVSQIVAVHVLLDVSDPNWITFTQKTYSYQINTRLFFMANVP